MNNRARVSCIAVMSAVAVWTACAFCFASGEDADTIYLKSGGKIDCIITAETPSGVEAEMGAGTIVINRADIREIRRASPEGAAVLRDRWAKDRAELKAQEESFDDDRNRRLEAYEKWIGAKTAHRAPGRDKEEGEVGIVRDPGSHAILVNTVLDGKVKALLELDTGASLVILSRRIGDRLGIDLSSEPKKDVMDLHLVGGRTVKAKAIVLKSIAIEGVEEKDVLAAVVLEDGGPAGLKDGLLGRSFLGRFSIRIDMQKMTMSLKKLGR